MSGVAKLVALSLLAAPLALALPAHAELPPLESRDIDSRPAPKSPQDMLLPGETLRSRWADPKHPQAPGREASVPALPARPRAGGGAALPQPLTITPIPAAPAPVAAAPVAAAPLPRPAAPAKGKPGKIRFGANACDGGYQVNGQAVDATGRACGLF
jgi:hypothetical protein